MENLDSSTAVNIDFTINDPDVFSRTQPLPTETDQKNKLAKEILKKIFQYRRTPNGPKNCDMTCAHCQSPHLPNILAAIESGKPVRFVLPAFPGKSPNLSKVLGTLPDMAEKLALLFLNELCEGIKEIHAPGAQMILCSDGRVFSDIVGMRETDVTDYQDELDHMIQDLGLKNISTFNLDELAQGNDFTEVRQLLMKEFGSPLEILKEKVLRGSKPEAHSQDVEAHRMYLGITRFLVEDSTFPGQTKSRTAIQKECKVKSYEVIRRSNAWSELVAEQFPEAVRLSIHPQTCGSKKLGLRLIGTESWMTPWHGVAVKKNEEFILLKRAEAESLGAKLVRSADGRASHYELPKGILSDALMESAKV